MTALSKMPNRFTSYNFSKMARRNGLTSKFGFTKFLKRHSIQEGYNKSTWIKMEATAPVNISYASNLENFSEEKIQYYISELKKTGRFKILEIVQEWKEI